MHLCIHLFTSMFLYINLFILVLLTINYSKYTMRATNLTSTISFSLSANRRCILVATGAHATSLSPLCLYIEGVLSLPWTHVQSAYPVAVFSSLSLLSVELKTHTLLFSCLGNTPVISRSTLVNNPRGFTAVSRLRTPCDKAGWFEYCSLSVSAWGTCQRTGVVFGDVDNLRPPSVATVFHSPLYSISSQWAVASSHCQGGA